MIRADTDLLNSLNALRGNGHFERVKEWLKKSLDAEREANDSRVGIMLYRGQGTALTLSQILKETEGAEEALRRSAQSKSRLNP